MKKRLISVLLLLSMLLCWVPGEVFAEDTYSGTCGENLTWTLKNGILTISGTGEMYDFNASESQPWGNSSSTIKKIIIEDGVTYIGFNAFNGTTATSVQMANSVTEIGSGAFYGCTSLESITLSDGMTRIGYSTFFGCTSLEGITIPEGVTEIDLQAFSGCTSLGSVTLPEGLTKIDWYAFSGCTSLKSIALPDSVTEIVDEAFSGCTSLESVTFSKNLKTIGMGAFWECVNLKSITLPDGLRAIGSGAFWGCTSLKSVTLPDEMTTIWNSTFYGCTSLESVTLPDGMTEILGWAFSGCTNLHSITIPATVTEIDDYAMGFDYDDETLEEAKMDSFEISGHTGSVAETYAEEFGFTFHAIHFYDDGTVTKESTCGTTGEKTCTCTVCGATKTERIAATGHTWDEGVITMEPTSTEQGETTYTCQTCGETKTEAIEVLKNPFTDLANPSSYYEPVLWAVDKNITKGTSSTEFSPETECTRAQIVTFLWRYAGEPEPERMEHNFVDVVDQNASYYKAVIWAAEQGITLGTDETHFSPDATCTRAQIVTFLWRYAGEPENGTSNFVDVVDQKASYYEAASWAAEQEITLGKDTTHFAPEDFCTRAQSVTFLWRYNNTK